MKIMMIAYLLQTLLAGGAFCAGFDDLKVSAADIRALASRQSAASGPAQVPAPAPSVGGYAGRYAATPFVFDPAVNEKLNKQLDIPVFFALPDSVYGKYSGAQLGGLWEYRHPASRMGTSPVGLRVYQTRRANVAQRLAAGRLLQTGDILLTFRPEWGGNGPYPNIQMGVSHAGMAIVENGMVSNIDMPLSDAYLGNLDSEHYREASALHVIRPRGLTAAQRANLLAWGKRLTRIAPQVYPAQLSFNQDYFSPKYTEDLRFVKTLARIALQQDKSAKIDVYCSEFVWALLALRDCDPARPEAFNGQGTPACVNPVFSPLPMLGEYFRDHGAPSSRLGLSDGPLAVIDSMGLPEPEKKRAIAQVFASNTKMSPGHAAVAESMAPFFGQLKGYYEGIQDATPEALQIMNSFNANVKPNYSPTGFLVNTLLPHDSRERKMDVVATIVFSD